jgi:hypothetical protein
MPNENTPTTTTTSGNTPDVKITNQSSAGKEIKVNEKVEETNLEASEEMDEASEESSEKDAQEADKRAKEEVKRKKKLKLKVDGKEFEEEIDLDDDEYLTKQIQLAKAAQKRMQEYSQLEKEVGVLLDELKKNPRKVLADPNIGVDLKELAAQILQEEIENSKKSPEQLEREKLEAELKALKEEREKEKEDLKSKELERFQEQAYANYDMAISQALEKSDLPKTPYVVKKMAEYMLLGLQEGLDVQPQDVIPLVKDEMQEDIKQMFSVMPDEVVENIVGKDVINRIRKKSLAKAKEKPPTPVSKMTADTGTKEEKKPSDDKKLSFKQFFGV